MREKLYHGLHLEFSKCSLEKHISQGLIKSQCPGKIYEDIYKNIFDHLLTEIYFTDNFYSDGYDIYPVDTVVYQSDLNIIMYQNNLIQNIITLVVLNVPMDHSVKIIHTYNNIEYTVNISTITLFLLLYCMKKIYTIRGYGKGKNVSNLFHIKLMIYIMKNY